MISECGSSDYWMNQIETGLQTRTQVLTGFSESPENQAQVIGVIQHGIEYTQRSITRSLRKWPCSSIVRVVKTNGIILVAASR